MEMLSDVLGIVSSLQKESKHLSKHVRFLLKRRKKHTTTKSSSFHTLIGRSKKGQQSHKGIQAESSHQTCDKGCQTDILDETSHNKTFSIPMDEDDQLIKSPVVSQYGVHFYGSTSTTSPTIQIAPVTSEIGPKHPLHNQHSPVHTSPPHSPVHTSPPHIPIHNTEPHDEPVHNPNHNLSPVHNTPLHSASNPNPTSPNYLRTRSVIYDSSAHPNSSETHLPCPDPPSFGQPRYDSSMSKFSPCQLPFTPDTSPNKSEGSLSGFIGHSRTINAFSATATSIPLFPNIQEDSDIVELSEGSPERPRQRHVPSREENQLAGELNRVNTIPAVDLIAPLPQIQWDIFQRIMANHKNVFHITPSHFEFTNNFLLQLAQPQHWTSAYLEFTCDECSWTDEQNIFFWTNNSCGRGLNTSADDILIYNRTQYKPTQLNTGVDRFNPNQTKFDFLDTIEYRCGQGSQFSSSANRRLKTSYDDQRMSSSSSSSSRQGGRRQVHGVPTKCWCGQSLDTWVSDTKENPGRRFYRCRIALQKKTESHLFKWIEENLLDEIRMVDAKRMDLLSDFQALTLQTKAQLDSQRNWIGSREEQLKNEITEKMMQLSRSIDESTKKMTEQIQAEIHCPNNRTLHTDSPLFKTAALVAIGGAMSYLFWKMG
ncbi:unnamed protein product [Eruca vesicaria subsp. sativa]|uniref:GRF-type domain-containing protein n=1 Tax=Eruca vesicaria subsp. sativa TaxID=29727 RepID=A0ABC8JZN4_ERUVS|nr:unnamed protein product [Eruca vesicaria subsp. sativa]